ncbi:MAG: diaminopimelate epimerase [Clostridia bacterium]|nr:diaminopimelate epimerase [Clostridia bacterium]
MKFTKMHGIGNDYIYFNCFEETVDNPEELSIRLSDRHFGVGGDGIVLIMPSDKADFRMRMFNADGSEGKMCGNATRCIGKFVYDKGLTDKTRITLETLSGIKILDLDVKDGKVEKVTVDMGKANFKAGEIPVISGSNEVVEQELTVGDRTDKITCVSMGNPHCVIFTEGIDSLELEKIGPGYENHPMFPERINTEFVEFIDPHTLKMRVWERGSGETLACGTGACATVSAAVKTGRCPADEFVTVKLIGGNLEIMYKTDGTVIMKGPAAFSFEGEIK